MIDTVTVIIPTMARRLEELDRAIGSVTSQDHITAIPLVVVNGDQYDVGDIAKLRQRSDIRYHQIETAGVSKARLEARKKVETPYFAFLDDDDELLPGALKTRLSVFSNTEADVVVTNGYRQTEECREIIFPKFGQDPDDPARALLEENWLASAGGLYRTETVDERYFEELPNFFEMTVLAFKMTKSLSIIRLNQPTFVIHSGATDQASNSWQYYQELPGILGQMKRITTRPDLRSRLKQKQTAAYHAASTEALERRDKKSAWKFHVRSLMSSEGLKYLPYTRHILLSESRL